MTRSVWKGPFADSCMFKPKKGSRWQVWSRRSCVFPQFVGTYAHVYNGKSFVGVKITDDMVGHKFGEFAATRRAPNKNARTKGGKGGKGGGGKGGKKGFCTQALAAISPAWPAYQFVGPDVFARRPLAFGGAAAGITGQSRHVVEAGWQRQSLQSAHSAHSWQAMQIHSMRKWGDVSSLTAAVTSGKLVFLSSRYAFLS